MLDGHKAGLILPSLLMLIIPWHALVSQVQDEHEETTRHLCILSTLWYRYSCLLVEVCTLPADKYSAALAKVLAHGTGSGARSLADALSRSLLQMMSGDQAEYKRKM